MDQGTDNPAAEAYISPLISDTKVRDHVATAAIETNRVGWLVDRAQGGDRDAFGELYRLCHGTVFRFVRFHLPGPEGEDVVAETFLERGWPCLATRTPARPSRPGWSGSRATSSLTPI